MFEHEEREIEIEAEIAMKSMGEYFIEALLRNNVIGIIGQKATSLLKFGKYS